MESAPGRLYSHASSLLKLKPKAEPITHFSQRLPVGNFEQLAAFLFQPALLKGNNFQLPFFLAQDIKSFTITLFQSVEACNLFIATKELSIKLWHQCQSVLIFVFTQRRFCNQFFLGLKTLLRGLKTIKKVKYSVFLKPPAHL